MLGTVVSWHPAKGQVTQVDSDLSPCATRSSRALLDDRLVAALELDVAPEATLRDCPSQETFHQDSSATSDSPCADSYLATSCDEALASGARACGPVARLTEQEELCWASSSAGFVEADFRCTLTGDIALGLTISVSQAPWQRRLAFQ